MLHADLTIVPGQFMPPLVELHLNGSHDSVHTLAMQSLDLATAEALDAELARCEAEVATTIATARAQAQTRIAQLSHPSLFDDATDFWTIAWAA